MRPDALTPAPVRSAGRSALYADADEGYARTRSATARAFMEAVRDDADDTPGRTPATVRATSSPADMNRYARTRSGDRSVLL